MSSLVVVSLTSLESGFPVLSFTSEVVCVLVVLFLLQRERDQMEQRMGTRHQVFADFSMPSPSNSHSLCLRPPIYTVYVFIYEQINLTNEIET